MIETVEFMPCRFLGVIARHRLAGYPATEHGNQNVMDMKLTSSGPVHRINGSEDRPCFGANPRLIPEFTDGSLLNRLAVINLATRETPKAGDDGGDRCGDRMRKSNARHTGVLIATEM